ncbi:MAG: hypothetical protein EXR37_04030 [Limnohabitans sp.]|nr:hypothetical protein [Limnohabitans sp.]
MVERTEAELNEKIEYGIELFYKDVLEKKDIRHFFFGLTTQRLIQDYHLFKSFVMAKPDRYYKDMIMQTAPSGVQIKAPQFDEVFITFQNVLRTAGFLKSEISKLAVHILEVMEETRAQKADADHPKVWQSFEVNNQLVCDFFNSNRTDARLEKNGDIYCTRGFLYPFWTRVIPNTTQIILIGQAFPSSTMTPVEEVKKFCQQVNEKLTHQKFEVRETPGGFVFFARHSFSYKNGVPVRLLLRCAKQFASNFEAAINMDNNQLLVKKIS